MPIKGIATTMPLSAKVQTLVQDLSVTFQLETVLVLKPPTVMTTTTVLLTTVMMEMVATMTIVKVWSTAFVTEEVFVRLILVLLEHVSMPTSLETNNVILSVPIRLAQIPQTNVPPRFVLKNFLQLVTVLNSLVKPTLTVWPLLPLLHLDIATMTEESHVMLNKTVHDSSVMKVLDFLVHQLTLQVNVMTTIHVLLMLVLLLLDVSTPK